MSVVIHEAAHIKRRDHWWKPLGYLLLTIYWFNPLCWVAYILLCRDIEMACDEKVVRAMDRNSKAMYSQALLNVNFPRKKIAACPLAFGEVGVKERVKSVLNYKKPAFLVILVAIMACIAVALCFMTNPKKAQKTDITAKNNTDGFFEAEPESDKNQNDEPLSNTEKQEVILHGEELAKYLEALPEDAESLSEQGCFVTSNNGSIYGAEHLSDFLEHYSAGNIAAITLGQYTTEGDLILYYVAFDGSQVIVTHDSRRDKFADPNYLYETENYKYLSLFEWTENNGSIYEEIVAYDDPDLTQKKMLEILASSEFIPGQKKQFASLGFFTNGTNMNEEPLNAVEVCVQYISDNEPAEVMSSITNLKKPEIRTVEKLPDSGTYMKISDEAGTGPYDIVTFTTIADDMLGPLEFIVNQEKQIVGIFYRE